MTPDIWATNKRKELQEIKKLGTDELLVFMAELLIDISNEISAIERNTDRIDANTA